MLITRDLRYIEDRLRAIVRHQLDATGVAKLNFRRLADHIAALAKETEASGLESAGALHRDFSVTPHAHWMADRALAKRGPEFYRNAGKRGGASRSMLKQAAAKRNGKKGGRPKVSNEQLLERLTMWANNLDSDPNYSREVAIKLVKQVPKLSLRLRQELIIRLQAANVDVGKFATLICGDSRRLFGDREGIKFLLRRIRVRKNERSQKPTSWFVPFEFKGWREPPLGSKD